MMHPRIVAAAADNSSTMVEECGNIQRNVRLILLLFLFLLFLIVGFLLIYFVLGNNDRVYAVSNDNNNNNRTSNRH
jgi:amino acid transporter